MGGIRLGIDRRAKDGWSRDEIMVAARVSTCVPARRWAGRRAWCAVPDRHGHRGRGSRARTPTQRGSCRSESTTRKGKSRTEESVSDTCFGGPEKTPQEPSTLELARASPASAPGSIDSRTLPLNHSPPPLPPSPMSGDKSSLTDPAYADGARTLPPTGIACSNIVAGRWVRYSLEGTRRQMSMTRLRAPRVLKANLLNIFKIEYLVARHGADLCCCQRPLLKRRTVGVIDRHQRSTPIPVLTRSLIEPLVSRSPGSS